MKKTYFDSVLNQSWKGQGLAIRDFFHGEKDATFTTICSDGDIDPVRAETFFREYNEFPFLEQAAVDLCYGRVLDIGAGAGAHTLELQERGLEVTAVEISPECVEVMRTRGVKKIFQGDYRDIKQGDYDTILMMMNGIGVVGDLDELMNFLHSAKNLISDDGQIVFDSVDLGDEEENDLRPVLSWLKKLKDPPWPPPPEYFGKLEYHIEYKHLIYPAFHWLFIDPVLLGFFAEVTGWFCEILYPQPDGKYIARLLKKDN